MKRNKKSGKRRTPRTGAEPVGQRNRASTIPAKKRPAPTVDEFCEAWSAGGVILSDELKKWTATDEDDIDTDSYRESLRTRKWT